MAANLDTGPKKSVTPELNVTPLVDVALVVLIIFMVVTPLAIRQMRVNVPNPSSVQRAEQPTEPLVLRMRASGDLEVNGTFVPIAELEPVIAKRIAAAGGAVSLEAEDGVPYGDVVRAADRCRRAGAETVSMATRAPS
ncbi:MAG: biopolymer transporter ExbD [Polyangiaceae bacterium]